MSNSDISNVNLSATRLFAILIILFFSIGPILLSGFLPAFVDIPSMAVTVGMTFALLLFNFGNDFIRFVPRSFVMLYTRTPVGNKRFAEIAYYGSRYSIGCGAFGTCVGLVIMLQDLSDPSKIGVGMAVALLTFLYGIVAAEFFFVPLHRAYSEDEEYLNKRAAFPMKDLIYGGCVVVFMLLTFFIPLLCFSSYDWNDTQDKGEAIIRTGYEIELPQIVFNPAGNRATKTGWVRVVAKTHSYDVRSLFEKDNSFGVCIVNRVRAKLLNELLKHTSEQLADPKVRKQLTIEFKDLMNSEIAIYTGLLNEGESVEDVLITDYVVR